MQKDLEAKLKAPINFPSPPGVAQQIIALAGDPEVTVQDVAALVSKDAGLTAKIMRTANSPMYLQRRRSENLRQALIVLGLNAATTLALSFSLVSGLRGNKNSGLDYTRYWQRSLLSALAARSLGECLKLHAGENLFLAGLLQDIGMAALDRVKSDFYAALPAKASHKNICQYEVEHLQADHSIVSTWLLKSWKLPEIICEAVEHSHRPEGAVQTSPAGQAARCIGFASDVVDFFMAGADKQAMPAVESRGKSLLGLTSEHLGEVLMTFMRTMPEMEQLFETKLVDADAAVAMMDQARTLVEMRSLESLQQASALQQTADALAQKAESLEDKSRRDALTGVFNRGHLDQYLAAEFDSSKKGGWPMSLVFVDLDHFKKINDTYGHAAGDLVLQQTAQSLSRALRESDFIARYGGEEFVIVMPGLDLPVAVTVCERLLGTLRGSKYDFEGKQIGATASLGLAALCTETPFAAVADLLAAADQCVYSAKRSGRDRLVVNGMRPAAAEAS
jgi:diguanylate cyclase (GGDEF)-like protein